MDYIRPNNNLAYYLFSLFIYCSCISVFWAQSYIDYVNMINNGYINDKSISFTLDYLEIPLEIDNNKNFILIQYDTERPQFKFVNIKGQVTLPPISTIDGSTIDYKSGAAIAGKDFDTSKIPQNYTLVGYFDTPNSYRLNSEVWLLSSELDLSKGNNLIFSTPNNKSMSLLEEVFTKNQIDVIEREHYGTYSLKSNELFTYIMYVFLIFLITAFFAVTYIWMSKEKYLINILFLSGTTRTFILYVLFRYKLLPHISIGLILLLIILSIEQFIYPLWSNDWIFHVLYTFIGLNLFLFILAIILVNINSTKKGGKKF